jgi:MOSC domain-containing protein YiiM
MQLPMPGLGPVRPTFEELETRYQQLPRPGRVGRLKLIVVRVSDGQHETPPRARVDVEEGLEGDRWAGLRNRNRGSQITLMNHAVAELVGAGAVPAHLAGDNFMVDIDLGTEAVPTGTRVRIGPVLVEVSAKPHTGCKKFSARFGDEALRWINHDAHAARRLRGVNCTVVEGGDVALEDPVEILG